jgi:2-keto-4-pentenoate hydratase
MTSPATTELAADPRVRAGMAAQLELRRKRLAAGERSLGWKLGFGTTAAMEKLGIAAPLVGFLTDRSVIAAGETPSVEGWVRPMLEPEIAATVGAVPAQGEIEAVGPAFELADVDPPPEDVEAILAANIFHRGVVLAEPAAVSRVAPGDLRAELQRPGGKREAIADPQAATGQLAGLVRHVAALLEAFGHALQPGEIVICGSLVPPIAVAGGDGMRYRLEPVGELAIALAA